MPSLITVQDREESLILFDAFLEITNNINDGCRELRKRWQCCLVCGINSDSGKFSWHQLRLWITLIEGAHLEVPETISGDLVPIQSLTIAGTEMCQTSESEKQTDSMDRCGAKVPLGIRKMKAMDVTFTQSGQLSDVGGGNLPDGFPTRVVILEDKDGIKHMFQGLGILNLLSVGLSLLCHCIGHLGLQFKQSKTSEKGGSSLNCCV